MDELYELTTLGNEKVEIGQEAAESVKNAIKSGAEHIEIGDHFYRTSAIMSIKPSLKNNHSYRRYINDKNNYGYRGSYASWCDEAGIDRQIEGMKQLEA